MRLIARFASTSKKTRTMLCAVELAGRPTDSDRQLRSKPKLVCYLLFATRAMTAVIVAVAATRRTLVSQKRLWFGVSSATVVAVGSRQQPIDDGRDDGPRRH